MAHPMDKPIVLVAEDDASVRMTIEFVLRDEGFDVVLAVDGEQALKLAKTMKPNVILLDQMMPKLDGHGVLSALREDEATREIPVFVLSGMSRTPGDWPGAHFVGKPFSPDDLVDRIRKAIDAPS
jgi:CheY-like chemotaxis protein